MTFVRPKVIVIRSCEGDMSGVCGIDKFQEEYTLVYDPLPDLLEALKAFPILLSPATTAWGKQVQEWQEAALSAFVSRLTTAHSSFQSTPPYGERRYESA